MTFDQNVVRRNCRPLPNYCCYSSSQHSEPDRHYCRLGRGKAVSGPEIKEIPASLLDGSWSKQFLGAFSHLGMTNKDETVLQAPIIENNFRFDIQTDFFLFQR